MIKFCLSTVHNGFAPNLIYKNSELKKHAVTLHYNL